MPDGPLDVSLTTQFSAIVKAGIAPEIAATWNDSLPRSPRLLVPIDVHALVVPEDGAVERAGIAVRLYEDEATPLPKGARAPEPFTNLDARPRGVYLHWAMPDGLTRGDVDADLRLNPLPDRWVVMRVEPGVRRNVRAWVLEGDRARRTPLHEWSETGPPGQDAEGKAENPGGQYIPSRDLHAMAGGDPAWAAVFDNVENRFGFRDKLEDVDPAAGALTYVVTGWYSDPALDPMFLGETESSFDRVMESLGWSYDNPRPSRAVAESVVKAFSAGALGLTSPLLLDLGAEKAVGPLLPFGILGAVEEVLEKTEPWWPRQSLYHGVIYGLRADGTGGDDRPESGAVTAVAGATQVEAVAALLASSTGDDAVTAERMQTAFGYGVVEVLGEPDGPARLEEEMHAQAFGSSPGGSIKEFIRASDPFDRLRPPPPEKIHLALAEENVVLRDAFHTFDFVAGTRRDALQFLLAKREMGAAERSPDEKPFEEVERALPRFYFPDDPAIVLSGLNRSLRHGYDGIHEPDEKLHCRITGSGVKSFGGVLRGSDVIATPLNHGGIPPECEELLREAALQDPFRVDDLVVRAVEASGLPTDAVSARIGSEIQLYLHGIAGMADVGYLLPASIREGTEPSPMAVTCWRQAWVPLYLEWEVELSLEDSTAGWSLGELDLEPRDLEPSADRPAPETVALTGRSLLTSSSAKNLRDRIVKLLAEEDKLEGEGRIPEADEEVLHALSSLAGVTDLVGAAVEGLREHMLGFDGNVAWEERGEDVVSPARLPRLLRAGRFSVRRLRVVDAFGRALDIDPPAHGSSTIRTTEDHTFLLRPRITAPSRLLVRFVDAATTGTPGPGSDGRPFEAEASLDQRPDQPSITPVSGWLLPDHVDGALEVFDSDGAPIGQVLHDPVSGAVTWEGAPGTPWPLGARAEETIADHSVAAMVGALVRRDAVERAGAAPRGDESPLSALLRVIDTTMWTVDPFGSSGAEYLGMLVGRPVAIVRAVVKLDVKDDSADYALEEQARAARSAAFTAFGGRSFEVRLGSLTHSQDGLLGYFVDDDYSRFYPVHPQVLRDAVRSGPRTGYLGSMHEAAGFHADVGAQSQEVTQPYVSHDPTIDVSAGRARILTLLMVPDAAVNVTSGIVPRKSLSLLREWIEAPLARLIPSLRIGPVLVDPETIRMPKPVHLGEEQVWTTRDGPTSWRDDPIVAATQEAILPKGSAVAQEGYIRMSPEPPAE